MSPHGPLKEFSVRIASSGQVFIVPEGRSIVAVLRDHGIRIPTSCGQGVCGACLTGVLEGEPEHRDGLLTDAERAENNVMTLCCSRSRTPLLVLDL
ncbi:MAG: 2Fe-2S iron-sulfur cluster binding domain-containing protein [Steroidobacteraceae bacterium]